MDRTATTPPALTVTSTQRLTVVRKHHADGLGDLAVMSMLQDHVPLALLFDLTSKDGPCSEEILAEEGAPETDWWVQ